MTGSGFKSLVVYEPHWCLTDAERHDVDDMPEPVNPCCSCCVAADERGELDHELHGGCPYPPCPWHSPARDADGWAW